MSNQIKKIKKISLYLDSFNKKYNFYIINSKEDEAIIDKDDNCINVILEMNKEVI